MLRFDILNVMTRSVTRRMVTSWALATDTHKNTIPQSNNELQKRLMSSPSLIRDFPFNLMIRTPARHMVINTTIGTAISTLLAINTVNTPPRKAPKHPNSPKRHHFDRFSTHVDR